MADEGGRVLDDDIDIPDDDASGMAEEAKPARKKPVLTPERLEHLRKMRERKKALLEERKRLAVPKSKQLAVEDEVNKRVQERLATIKELEDKKTAVKQIRQAEQAERANASATPTSEVEAVRRELAELKRQRDEEREKELRLRVEAEAKMRIEMEREESTRKMERSVRKPPAKKATPKRVDRKSEAPYEMEAEDDDDDYASAPAPAPVRRLNRTARFDEEEAQPKANRNSFYPRNTAVSSSSAYPSDYLSQDPVLARMMARINGNR